MINFTTKNRITAYIYVAGNLRSQKILNSLHFAKIIGSSLPITLVVCRDAVIFAIRFFTFTLTQGITALILLSTLSSYMDLP